MELHELVIEMKLLERRLTLYEEKYGVLSADFHAALKEIDRVLRPGGRFLVITEVNHEPTLAEPNCIMPDELAALLECKYDFKKRGLFRVRDDHNVYESVRSGDAVDRSSLVFGVPAIFTASCVKRG